MSPVSRCNRRERVFHWAARQTSDRIIPRDIIRRDIIRRDFIPGLAGRLALTLLALLSSYSMAAAASFPDDGSGKPARTLQEVAWINFAPADWVTMAPFNVSVTATSTAGLAPSGDEYSLSNDGTANWSPWSTAGLSTSISGTTTHDITVSNLMVPDSASQNFIRFRVIETGGAESVSPAYLLRVDATPPDSPQNLTANPGTWTNAASFTVSWSNPLDVAGIAGAWYKLDSAPLSPTDGTFVITSNSVAGITPGSPGDDGAHPVYVWLQDTFNRADQHNATTTTLYWDTTAPDPPTRMSGSPARQWVNINRFSESWRNPNDLSGIAGAYYKLNGLPNSATDGKFVKTVSSIPDIQVPGDGRHYIYVWLVDGAGNVDPEALTGDPEVFWYDGTLPVSASTVSPPLPATGWYTSSVSVSFSATDLPLEPVSPPVVDYQLDSAAWALAPPLLTVSSEGAHQLHYRARDKANNLEVTKDFNFGIDKTPPTATLQADRLTNATGWYTAAVTYTLSVADAVSGLPQGFYRLNDGPWQQGPAGAAATFTLGAEGSYRIEYYAKDAAGNRSNQNTRESHVDMSPPTTSLTIDGVQGDNGWHVSNVTGHLLPADNVSGAASTRYRINGGAWQTGTQFSVSGDGTYDLAYYSTDVAGNVGETRTAQIRLDQAAPASPTGLTAAPTGWSRTNSFSVEWISPSDLSGVTGAYVKLGDMSGGGAPTGPKDGAAIMQTQRIDGLAVPTEGAYRLYLWLRDAAGNADQKTAPADGPVLRYDATAPTTTVQVQGKAGDDGWWLSPITANLTATDSASGIATLHYRVDGGAWQSTNKNNASVPVSQPGQHTMEYYAEDVAGNAEAIKQTLVRLDFAAPPAPASARVLPQGWTRDNSFQIDWSTVADLSGISGAYVKFNTAPEHAMDGAFYSGSTQINGVKAPGEGRHSVYVWLRDGAGNVDAKNVVAANNSVWYDGTPPATDITPTPASGMNGWYVEPVTFAISARDAASGLREVRYQVDDGPVGSTNATAFPPDTAEIDASLVFSEQGRHTIRMWGVDHAGNEETAHVLEVAIDRTPPTASFTGPGSNVTHTQFDVSWGGADSNDGSGLASYDVQVRDGNEAGWQDWLTATSLEAAPFQAQRGHVYYFQVFGRDSAGNRQVTPGTWKVFVQPVLNGGFDSGTFPPEWVTGGQKDALFSSVVATTGPSKVSTLAARLGSETYGPSVEPPGNVPVGCATMSQVITIPALEQMRAPRLRFSYRVLTYDVIYSERLKQYVDTLDVTLKDEQGQQIALLVRAGNPTNTYGQLYDTGWVLADLDLRAYAGRTVQLSFANCNGPLSSEGDNMLNTWSFVDGVQVYERIPVYLPGIKRAAQAGVSAFAESENGQDSSARVTAEETAVPATADEVGPIR